MNKYQALIEDEDDILGGTPRSTYWGMASKISDDFFENEFDNIVQRLAVMENLLSKHYEIESLDDLIKFHYSENTQKIEELKKSLYIELGGKLLFKIAD